MGDCRFASMRQCADCGEVEAGFRAPPFVVDGLAPAVVDRPLYFGGLEGVCERGSLAGMDASGTGHGRAFAWPVAPGLTTPTPSERVSRLGLSIRQRRHRQRDFGSVIPKMSR